MSRSSCRQRPKSAVNRHRLRSESLERRDLLSGDLLNLDVSFKNGLLDIRANNHEDIIITADGTIDGNALVKINGRDPTFGPLIADQVHSIRAIGGQLSYIDLSKARRDKDSFLSLARTIESEPDDRWQLYYEPIDHWLDQIYTDPAVRSGGLSWPEKVERLEGLIKSQPATVRQAPMVGKYDHFIAAPEVSGASAAAVSSGDEGGIVDIIGPVEQPEYVDWMSFTVDHHANPNVEGLAFNGMTVEYTTNDGAADAPEDYVAVSGTLEWMDGEEGQNRVISIDIEQDNIWEQDEDFQVTLSNLNNMSGDEGNATLGTAQATGTILNDDCACCAANPGPATAEPYGASLESASFSDVDIAANDPPYDPDQSAHDAIEHRVITWDDFLGVHTTVLSAKTVMELPYRVKSGESGRYGGRLMRVQTSKFDEGSHVQSKGAAYDAAEDWVQVYQGESLVYPNSSSALIDTTDIDANPQIECAFLSLASAEIPPETVALMLRDLSTKESENLSNYLLEHEQGHFDISHIISERLNKEIADIRVAAIGATEQNAKLIVKNLMTMITENVVAAYLNEANNAQLLYDSPSETNHAQNEPRQLAWNAYLAGSVEFGVGPKLIAPE